MRRRILASLFAVIATSATADLLPVTQDAVFTVNGEEMVISRSSTVDPARVATLGRAPSNCAAPCIAPMIAAENVPTLGELEVIAFLSGEVEAGSGLLVDARMPADRALGFIPASVNIPALTLEATNPYRGDILVALGAQHYDGVFSFENALSLVIFDAGPASMDASKLVTNLVNAGYPAERIGYYRGGMQVWASLGLSTLEIAQ